MVSVEVDRPRTPAAARQLAAPAPTKARGPGAIPHFPGLEGLRGLAVVAVVAYHARYPWARGGFLGVSTFFTLSGFLITSLLLNERGATGTINLRQFWRRRFRRLMPAALAVLALVVAFGYTAADAVQRRNLAGDVLASLGYVANWRFLLAEQSYADIFGAASPVAHFWSLAIEEQFYLLLPLVAWFLLIKLRLGRAAFALSLVALTAASLALTLYGGLSADAAYYHTGTRAAELLIGALMAAAVFDRRVTRPLGRNRGVQAAVSIVGIGAFIASVYLWVVVEHSGDESPWLYRGGFAAYSLLTVAVILAAVTPAGPVRWVLAQWPLRALGLISYGIYLYHWPVFVWLTPGRTGLDEPALSGVRLLATLTLAIVSYNLIEAPIRHAKNPRINLTGLAVPVVVAIAGAVIAVTLTAPRDVIDFESASAEMASLAARGGAPPPPPDVSQREAPFPRVAFYGDSTSLMTGIGMLRWSEQTKQASVSAGVSRLGCGIGRGGERRHEHGEIVKVPDVCNRWELEFRQSIENEQPNVAVVQIGPWEVAPRRLEGSDQWTGPGDPAYDRFMMEEMLRAVDVLSSRGAVVVWMSSPRIRVEPGSDEALRGQTADPARMDRLNELIRELPGKRPGKVAIVDLAGWLASTGDDVRLRPDGIHFHDSTTREVSERFVADAVISTYRKLWAERSRDASPASTGLADHDDLGRYLTNRYKALLVGDSAAELVSSGVKAWADKTGGIQLSTAIRPNCGLLRTSAREGPSGRLEPTPPDCQSFRQWIIDRVRAEQPDFVIIVPSELDYGTVRLASTTAPARWGDAGFEKNATQHFADLVRQINAAKSVVLWANPPLGEPGKGGPGAAAKVLPATDHGTAQRYDVALATIQVGDGKGMRRLDLANWAAGNLPALRDGGDLSVEAKTSLGEWIAAQAYLDYDGGPKLKPAPAPR